MVQKNAVSWFEIPTKDLNRAQKFYEAIFGITMTPLDVAQIQMRMFPLEDPMSGVGGALVYNADFYKSSATDGPLVYLNANPDVQNVLSKVENAGGKVLVPKTQISPEYGYMAMFLDTEGNRIALHATPDGK
jgi:predicted enzyme related to lactoylglutathione lyase